MMDKSIRAHGHGPIPLLDLRMVECAWNTASQEEDVASSVDRTFTKTDHVLEDKERSNCVKKIIEVTCSDRHPIKLEINSAKSHSLRKKVF